MCCTLTEMSLNFSASKPDDQMQQRGSWCVVWQLLLHAGNYVREKGALATFNQQYMLTEIQINALIRVM